MTPSFTLAQWMILVAALLPIVCAGIAKSGLMNTPRGQGGYDNHDPRAWLAKQGDWRARANHAQSNSFEALPIFVAGVLIAQAHGAAAFTTDALAVVFVLARVAYIAAYLADRANLRTLCWVVALGCAIALFFV